MMTYLTAGAGLIVLFFVAACVRRWPQVGWAIVVAMVILDTDATAAPIVKLDGIAIFWPDLVATTLSAAALLRCGQLISHVRNRSILAEIVFCGLLGASMLRGLATYGLSAFPEFRPYYYLAAAVLWSLTLEWNGKAFSHFRTWLSIGGYAVACLAIVNMMTHGVNSSSDFYVDQTGTYRSLRPIVSAQAAFLAAATLSSISQFAKDRRLGTFIAPVVFVSVLVLAQQRTVWLATAFAIVAIGVCAPSSVRWRMTALLASGTLGIAVTALSNGGTQVLNSVSASMVTATATDGTLSDRTTGWASLVDQNLHSGVIAVLLGQSFGSGYSRLGQNGVVETYMPHNWYVSIFVRAGLLGLLALISVILKQLARTIRNHATAYFDLAILVFFVVYGFAYSIPWYLGPVLVAIWSNEAQRHEAIVWRGGDRRLNARAAHGRAPFSRPITQPQLATLSPASRTPRYPNSIRSTNHG